MAANLSLHNALELSALRPPQDPYSSAKPGGLLRSEGPSPGALTAAVLQYVTTEAKIIDESDPSLGALVDLVSQEPSLSSELDRHIRETLLANLMVSIAQTGQGMNGYVHELQNHLANRLFSGEVNGPDASAATLGAALASPSCAFEVASEAVAFSPSAASLPFEPPPGLCAPPPGLSLPAAGGCDCAGSGTVAGAPRVAPSAGGGVHLDDAALDLFAASLAALFAPPSSTSAAGAGASTRHAAGAGAGAGNSCGCFPLAEASSPPSAFAPPSTFSRPSPASVPPSAPAAALTAPSMPLASLTPTKSWRPLTPVLPEKTVPVAQDGGTALSEGALLVLHGLPADWKEADTTYAISATGFIPGDDFEVLTGGARGRLADPFVRFVHPAAARALRLCLAAGSPPKANLSASSLPLPPWPWPEGVAAEFPDGEVIRRRAIAFHRHAARVR